MDVGSHGGDLFAIARERGWHWKEILDFSASINPLGPAPGVRQAVIDALDRISHYPERYAAQLQQALAEQWDLDPQRILLGNGATELIHFFARMWPGNATLATPVFSEFHRAYPHATLLRPGESWPDDGLLIATNPVNPTGAATSVPRRRGYTLIDESFIEFSDLSSRMHDGFIVLRSLTKFHALPGLRLGALVGPLGLMRELRSKREPWQVNVLAEAAALEALRDKEHQRTTVGYVRAEQARLWELYKTLPGVRLHPTHANYYFSQLDYSASALCDYLLSYKLLLRDCAGWPGVEGQSVRFAIRTQAENDKLFSLWRAFPCD